MRHTVLLLVLNVFLTHPLFSHEIFVPSKNNYITGHVHEYSPAVVEEFEIDLPKSKNKHVVNVKDFGADPNKDNNYQAFSDAITKCREINASRLVIEPGIYHIQSDQCLDFCDLKDVTVEGSDAELVLYVPQENIRAIEFNRCTRVHIKDLIMDWNWEKAPIACIATIVNMNATEKYFDLEMGIRHPGEHPIRSIEPFHPEKMTFGSYEYAEIGNWLFVNQEWIDSNVLRIWTLKSFQFPLTEKHVGKTYRARYYDFQNHAVMYTECNHITFENIRLYSAAGTGFSGAQDCEYIHFLNCQITKRPGTDRIISTAADQCMTRNSRGHIKFEGCDFGYGGDDPINIHPANHLGFKRISANEIELTSSKLGWWTPFEINDLLEFRHHNLSPTGFVTTIRSIDWSADRTHCRIVLNDMLPVYVREDSFIFDHRWFTRNYIIRNCHFHHNRGRGILAQSSNGLIENCVFDTLQGSAIYVEAGWESRWSEGFGVQNLIIRNNSFKNCNISDWKAAYGDPVIYVGTYLPVRDIPAHVFSSQTDFPVFDGIVFSNNEFSNVAGSLFSINSARRIVIRKNQFNTTRPRAQVQSYSGSILLGHCSDVCIEQNDWHQYETTYWKKPGLVLDSETVKNVKFTDNAFRAM